MPKSSTFVASNSIFALSLNVIKHILSFSDKVETTVFKECLTKASLVKPPSSLLFFKSLAAHDIEPETSIIDIKSKGFLDSIFLGSIVTFTKTSSAFLGLGITSALNESISGIFLESILAVFLGISGILPIFKKFSIKLFKA